MPASEMLRHALLVRTAGHVTRMGEKRNVYRLLVGKPEEETTRKTET
jgi:hypothetical protein